VLKVTLTIDCKSLPGGRMTTSLSATQRALLVAAALPNGTEGSGNEWYRTIKSLEKLGLVTLQKRGNHHRADATAAGRAALQTK
jgi:hypothetical protein